METPNFIFASKNFIEACFFIYSQYSSNAAGIFTGMRHSIDNNTIFVVVVYVVDYCID